MAEFACRRARLIVELDGSQHADNAADLRRTASLESEGWHVLRFWNNEVAQNLDGVVEAIRIAVTERLPEGETPHFIASRAGRVRRPRSRGKEEGPPPTLHEGVEGSPEF